MADIRSNPSDVTAGRTETTGIPDWSTEETYWRSNFGSRPYASADKSFDQYQPAYRYGYESATRHRGRQWNDVESDLERGWDRARGESKSTWQDIKDAVRDAWHRVERALPGDADRDGR